MEGARSDAPYHNLKLKPKPLPLRQLYTESMQSELDPLKGKLKRRDARGRRGARRAGRERHQRWVLRLSARPGIFRAARVLASLR